MTALTQPTPEKLREEIRKTRSLIKGKDKVFGVNLTILPMFSKVPYDQYVQVIIDEGITIVETAGRPPSEFIHAFKEKVNFDMLSFPFHLIKVLILFKIYL